MLFLIGDLVLPGDQRLEDGELARQGIVGIDRDDAAVVHPHDAIEATQHMQLMRRQHAASVLEQPADGLVEDVSAHMRIDRRQRVVHQDDLGAIVDRARQIDALLLPAGQGDASLADLRHVAGGQDAQAGPQRAGVHHAAVPVRIELVAKDDVVAHRGILDPGVLRAEGPRRRPEHQGALDLAHLPSQRGQQRRLPGPDAAHHRDQLATADGQGETVQLEDGPVRPVVGLLLVCMLLLLLLLSLPEEDPAALVVRLPGPTTLSIHRQCFLPGERGVDQLDGGRDASVPDGQVLGLLGQEERLDAFHGRPAVDNLADGDGEPVQRRAQAVEEGQRREDDGRVEPVAGQGVGDEGEEIDKDGHGHRTGADGAAQGQQHLHRADLPGPDRRQPPVEGSFPGEVLDEAHALEHLLRQIHALVADGVDDVAPAGQQLDDARQAQEAEDQHGHAGQGAVREVDDEHDDRQRDGQGAGSEQMQDLEGFEDALRVVGHEIHDASVGPAGGGGGSIITTTATTTSPGAVRQTERFGKEGGDQGAARLAADDHGLVDPVAVAQALQDLHDDDADEEADALSDPVPGRGRLRKGDEIADGEGRKDQQHVRQQPRDASDPDLAAEGVVDGERQGIGFAARGPEPKGLGQAVAQLLDGAVGIDEPDVVVLEGSKVACLYMHTYISTDKDRPWRRDASLTLICSSIHAKTSLLQNPAPYSLETGRVSGTGGVLRHFKGLIVLRWNLVHFEFTFASSSSLLSSLAGNPVF